MDTFKSIIDKISEGLNFFDFSFFVSGFVTYVTLLYFSNEFFGKTIDYTSVSGILTSVILSYVCGIVSFSLGKWMRSKILWLFKWDFLKHWKNKSFDDLFQEGMDWVVKNNNIKTNLDVSIHDFHDSLAMNKNKAMVYSAMWIEIRKFDEKGVFYRPLYRQWVMQAICEGLMFSFLLIMVLSMLVFWKGNCNMLYIIAFFMSLFSFVACCHEARRYAENQIKEVIISYFFLIVCK